MTSTLLSTSLRVEIVLDIYEETAPDYLVPRLPVVLKLSDGEMVELSPRTLLESADGTDLSKFCF